MATSLRLPLSPLVFQLPERLTEVNAWHGHLPFAFWVVEALEPSIFVELGVHRGDSYFGFCQAVKALGLPTRCFAVDTWQGDENAGFYGEEVYEDFCAYNARYADFSTPVRTTFREAVERFEERSIDLLHIDGYHTYESVRDDFSMWLPKLSDRAVVLLHDIAVKDRGFGVWRLWEEVSREYPSFGFVHSHGLGVLGIGTELPETIVDFFDEAKAQPELVRGFFEALGTRCILQGELQRAAAPTIPPAAEDPRLAQEILDLTYDYEQALERKEAEAEALEAQLAALEARAASAERTVAELSARLGHVVAQRDEILQSETWKATAPARSLLWWVRRVYNWRRFARRSDIALKPLQGATTSLLEPDRLVALGGRSRFQIDGPSLLPGWYELRLRLEVTSNLRALRPYVITETKDHQRYSQQLPASAGSDGEVRILFHVNQSSASHELLLIGLSGTFAISAVRVAPAVGVESALLRALAQALAPSIAWTGTLPALAPQQELLGGEDDFSRWIERNERLGTGDRERVAAEIAEWNSPPLISVLMPVYNTPARHLVTAIESVRAQWYPYWELCIADDASTDPAVRPILERYRDLDPRIKVAFRETNGGISANSNTALSLATGSFVAYMDADDELSEVALYHYAKEIRAYPDVELLFCDEDKLTEDGDRSGPYFKPSFSPELLLGKNCVTHLGVYRTETVRRLGGMRSAYDGSQDWDLALRFIPIVGGDNLTRARRIPHLLYHWRMIHGSTAASPNFKSWAITAGHRAVQDYLDAVVPGARVEPVPQAPYLNRVHLPLPDPAPLVSVLLPTAGDYQLLRACLDSLLERTDYPRLEILVDNNGNNTAPETLAYLDTLERAGRVRLVRRKRRPGEAFNFSRIVNNLARHANGELLLLLNDDTEAIDAGWLREMVSVLSIPGVGIVGAHLLYPDGTIQHAGILASGHGGRPEHLYPHVPDGHHGYAEDLLLLRNVSAVTGACLLIPRSLFWDLGALPQTLAVAYNDIALCFAAISNGRRVVITPSGRLLHHESATRGYETSQTKELRLAAAANLLARLYPRLLAEDPYFNPNFARSGAYPFRLGNP